MKSNTQGRIDIVTGDDHDGIVEKTKADKGHCVVNETYATLGH